MFTVTRRDGELAPPASSVDETISAGNAVEVDVLTMNAGFGATSPFAATHGAQSCESERVTDAAGTVTEKPLLSSSTFTAPFNGRRLSTVMRVDCEGTTHRRSRIGDLGTSVGRPQAARSASGIALARARGSRYSGARAETVSVDIVRGVEGSGGATNVVTQAQCSPVTIGVPARCSS